MAAQRKTRYEGIDLPRLTPKPNITELPEGQFLDDQGYAGLALSNQSMSDLNIDFLGIERSQFKQLSLSRTNFRRAQLDDVSFESCDLAQAEWEQLNMRRVEFTGSRLIGWVSYNSTFQHVIFRGCNLTGAQFTRLKSKNMRFEQCILRDVDFQQADLSGVVFERCDLSFAKMSEATLAGTDFRSSIIEGVRVGIKELQGAIVDTEQAVSIARMLGLVVETAGAPRTQP
jgi:uncharacterized protein YjbI with pentapeptide repeats